MVLERERFGKAARRKFMTLRFVFARERFGKAARRKFMEARERFGKAANEHHLEFQLHGKRFKSWRVFFSLLC